MPHLAILAAMAVKTWRMGTARSMTFDNPFARVMTPWEQDKRQERNEAYQNGEKCRVVSLHDGDWSRFTHNNAPAFQKCYHYTNKQGYEDIKRTGCIEGSGANFGDASHGRGSYGTKKSPQQFGSKRDVLLNNYYPSQTNWLIHQLWERVLYSMWSLWSLLTLALAPLLWVPWALVHTLHNLLSRCRWFFALSAVVCILSDTVCSAVCSLTSAGYLDILPHLSQLQYDKIDKMAYVSNVRWLALFEFLFQTGVWLWRSSQRISVLAPMQLGGKRCQTGTRQSPAFKRSFPNP